MNAYRIIESIRDQLHDLIEREEAKHMMDNDLVTGHLDDLLQIESELNDIIYFDGS